MPYNLRHCRISAEQINNLREILNVHLSKLSRECSQKSQDIIYSMSLFFAECHVQNDWLVLL